MNAVQVPAASYVDSASILDYEPTKPQRALFEKFDKVIHYLALANKKPPSVRLSRTDYAELNNRVIQKSGGARSLATVTYKGYPILSAAE